MPSLPHTQEEARDPGSVALAEAHAALHREIAAREQAEAAVRRSEGRLRALMENARELTLVVDRQGVIVYASPSITHILGLQPAPVLGTAFCAYVHPQDSARVSTQLASVGDQADACLRLEFQARHHDGSWRRLECIASRPAADCPFEGIVLNARDVTQRRATEMERATRRSQQAALSELSRYALRGTQLTAIFDLAAKLVSETLGTDYATVTELLPGRAQLVIRAGCGWEPGTAWPPVTNWRGPSISLDGANSAPLVIEDLLARPGFLQQPHPPSAENPLSALSVVIQSQGRPFGTLCGLSKTRRTFSEQDLAFMQTMADLLSTVVDRKGIEEERRAVEARYERIVANVPGMVYQHVRRADGSYELSFVSDGCREVFEVDPDFLRRNPAAIMDLIHAEDRAGLRAAVHGSAQALAPLKWEGRLMLPGGRLKWAVIHARPERQPDGGIIWEGLVMDVTQFKRIQEEMRAAKEEAERANNAKSEFLSRMSHELRTPLNAILGFGQLLELEPLPASQARAVEQIVKGGRHLLDLINEVLDIARIEAGGIDLALAPTSVRAALNEAVELVRPLAEKRHIRLEPCEGACAGDVIADPARLNQILLNLLSNAVKYNRDGGTVAVRCQTLPGGLLRIEIADTGPGLTPEEVGRLFTPFERLGAARRGIEGTGIGLTICQSLAHAMHGSVGVDSQPGRGSTFYLILPGASERPLPPAPPDGIAASPRRRRKLLHIEDRAATRDLVENTLGGGPGMHVLSAANGRMGIALAIEHRPDAILLDLQLPDLPGEEVLRRLRVEPLTRAIPVLVTAADATTAQLERLQQFGIPDFIAKPLDLVRLLHLIDLVMAPK